MWFCSVVCGSSCDVSGAVAAVGISLAFFVSSCCSESAAQVAVLCQHVWHELQHAKRYLLHVYGYQVAASACLALGPAGDMLRVACAAFLLGF